jgi:integral membrane protein
MLLTRAFRWIAVAEALSWLILIIATVVKYAADAPGGVKVMGPIHGALFTLYVLLVLMLRAPLRWSLPTLALVVAESVVPGGGFLAARRTDLRAREAIGTPTGDAQQQPSLRA